ncbi:kinase-like domain-containing protein [Phyllosticta citrichinensis]|uniref:Kinase-like domain-containing protein n=1 Tax=Phyllosticta citrichinensis TaxID=1130410 RepID=A0ABR1XWZ8_9PEZI
MATLSTVPAPGLVHRKFQGCSKISDYEVMGKLGEGTFGEVHKARSRRTSAIVALKKILMHNEKDGFPITALREIKLLKLLSHPNVLKLEEMAVERSKGEGRKRAILYMVTPYMDHDLSGLLDNPEVRFVEPQIKCYMLQLLEGLRYLHDNQILHRDMKAANLLINNRGILQIADFGLARHYDEPVPQAGKGCGEAQRDYTALVVTRWYRPPELLLQLRRYTPAIDMWGAGCVFGEMFKRKPILAGNSDINQAQIIFDLVGSPNEDNMPGWSQLPGCDGVKQFAPRKGNLQSVFRDQDPLAISLLNDLLKLDWRKRLNAIDALNHPYFKARPLPAKPEDLPRFADSHELDRRTARGKQQALPPAPAGGTVGMGPNPNGEWPVGPPNGAAFANGDRYPPRDRGPPGTGSMGHHYRGSYDGRVPPPPGPYDHRGPPPDRRRPWDSDSRRGNMPYGPPPNARLPPPPPEGSMHPLPHPPSNRPYSGARRGVGNANVDTYIPSYADGGRRNSTDRGSTEREDHRSSRDRSRPPSRDDRRGFRERDWSLDYDEGSHRRTRSRSPVSSEAHERRERERRDRDREIYSRR